MPAAKTNKPLFQAEFDLDRETKNTFRFEEDSDNEQPPGIRTLYLQRWVTGKDSPERIRVTVEVV